MQTVFHEAVGKIMAAASMSASFSIHGEVMTYAPVARVWNEIIV